MSIRAPRSESFSDSSLGSHCQDCVPREESAIERRFRLQDLAAKLLPDRRVSDCLNTIAPGALGVSVMVAQDEGRAFYKHLITCNRVWECPVCAERISAARRDELGAALVAARLKGFIPVIVAYTVRHDRFDALAGLLDALLQAVRAFKAGRDFQDLKCEYGWSGSVRSLEVTYGANGWHPHCHELVFLRPVNDAGEPIPFNVEGFRRWVAERWSHVAAAHGLSASLMFGVNVQTADDDIADYVAKFGREPAGHWGAADEIGRAPAKRANRDGLTPFQILELSGEAEDSVLFERHGDVVPTPKHAGRLFIEYVEAFERRNQLVWSRGLRDLLNMGQEKDNAEIEENQTCAVEVLVILRPHWKRVCDSGARGTLLRVAARNDAQALDEYLRSLGIVRLSNAGVIAQLNQWMQDWNEGR